MSECNCSCCCAYLNPPWWVTMGYAPPASLQLQRPQSTSPTSDTPPPKSPPQGTLVTAPPPRSQATPLSPTVTRPSVSKVVSDVATGDPVSVISDLIQLL